MYKSPVEVVYNNISEEIGDGVYRAVCQYGVIVDKDELIKALRYDRDQYGNGYSDAIKSIEGARASAIKEFAERAKEIVNGHLDYALDARIDAELICTDINNLVKEKAGECDG